MSQNSQTLLVDIEAGEPDRHRRWRPAARQIEVSGTPGASAAIAIASAAASFGQLAADGFVVIAVVRQWASPAPAAASGCGSNPALQIASSAGRYRRLVGIDSQLPLAELERSADASNPSRELDRFQPPRRRSPSWQCESCDRARKSSSGKRRRVDMGVRSNRRYRRPLDHGRVRVFKAVDPPDANPSWQSL